MIFINIYICRCRENKINQKLQNLMVSNFFDACEFCFDADFGVPFFCQNFDFLHYTDIKGSLYIHRKIEHQNLHQNKMRKRQKIQNFVILIDVEFRFSDICTIQCVPI